MQKLYIDFDSTLFDSDKYLQEMYNICENYNIKRADLDNIINLIFEKNNQFFINDLLNFLLTEKRINQKIKGDFKKLETTSFLYKDTIWFLKSIQDKFNPILLTCGNIDHQQKKINASKISQYFSNIIITPSNKSELKEVDYKNSIFIDNNPKEIERLLSAGAKRVIRIKRESDKYSKIDCYNKVETYSNFKEILRVL